jgi:hypothetical protein
MQMTEKAKATEIGEMSVKEGRLTSSSRTIRSNMPILTDKACINGIPVPEHRNLSKNNQIHGQRKPRSSLTLQAGPSIDAEPSPMSMMDNQICARDGVVCGGSGCLELWEGRGDMTGGIQGLYGCWGVTCARECFRGKLAPQRYAPFPPKKSFAVPDGIQGVAWPGKPAKSESMAKITLRRAVYAGFQGQEALVRTGHC